MRLMRYHARFVLSEPSGNGSVGLGSLGEPLLPACRRDPCLSSGRGGGAAPRRPAPPFGAPRPGPARPGRLLPVSRAGRCRSASRLCFVGCMVQASTSQKQESGMTKGHNH